MYSHITQKGPNRSRRSRQEGLYQWSLVADRLLFSLTSGRNRHSQRFLRGDLEYLRRWLNEPDLAFTLATLFGGGHDDAVDLIRRHVDHMVAAGYTVATINRHLCTLRLAARIARDMGEIDWDLRGIANCDNSRVANAVNEVQVDPEDPEGAGPAKEVESKNAEKKGCY